MPVKVRKENIKISIKKSLPGQGLDLKEGELGTDGQNLFIGKSSGSFSVTVPIGTIVLWLPVAFDDSNNTTLEDLTSVINLPRGWSIANGDKNEDENSPYYGYHIPNLSDEIFLQGSTDIGGIGGTNDSSHKHNIAHYHKLFNGANNQSGYIVAVGNHTHTYSDYSGQATALGEEGSGAGGGPGLGDAGRSMNAAGLHGHTATNIPVALQSSGLLINSTSHVNMGNSRITDDSGDFTENRPKYISGTYIIKTR